VSGSRETVEKETVETTSLYPSGETVEYASYTLEALRAIGIT